MSECVGGLAERREGRGVGSGKGEEGKGQERRVIIAREGLQCV